MTHFGVLLTLASIIGISSLISRFSKQEFALSFLHAQIGIVFGLYIGGLLQALEFTCTVIRVIGWMSFALVSLPALLANMGAAKKHANLFLLVVVPAFYLQTLTPNYYSFASVDDYSHWASISRSIALYGRFVVSSDPIGVKDYPPGLAVIHCFYTSIAGYRDNLVLFAQGVFVFSCFAILFMQLDRVSKELRSAAFYLLLLTSLSLSWIFFLGLHTLWADLPLGLLFGIALVLFFTHDDLDSGRILKLAPLVLFMPLVKQIGLIFLIIFVLILLIDVVYKRARFATREVIVLSTILLLGIAIDSSWKFYLAHSGIQRTFQTNFGIIEIVKAFLPAYASTRQKLTFEAFTHHFFGKISFTTYWILLTFVSAIAAYSSSHPKVRHLVLVRIGAGYLGLTMYLALLLVLYMFSFSEFEGVRVASIDRYTKTYLLGLLIAFGGLFFVNAITSETWRWKKLWIGIMAFLFIAPNIGRVVGDLAKSAGGKESRLGAVKIRSEANRVAGLTNSTAKIYFIWSEGSNDESVIFNYGIFPRFSNRSCSSIRPKDVVIDSNDPWSCSMDFKQFSSRIADYDYLYVGRVSEELRNSFFLPMGVNKISAGELYSISGEPGNISLEKL
jgi:hypothetical protein